MKKIDLFSPYILIIVIFIYLALAVIGFQYHIRNLQYPSPMTFFLIIFGCFFIILGIVFPLIIYQRTGKLESLFKKKSLDKSPDPKWYSKIKFLLSEKVLLAALIFSLFLQGLNLYLLGGLPIFSGYLKFQATTDLWRISYLIFLPTLNLLIAKYPSKWYYLLFIIGLGLFAVTGYRTTTIAILLSVFITTYYTRKLKTSYIIAFIGVIALIGIAVGYIAVKSIEWQQWSLNPFELIFYRAGFTTMVLDKIVPIMGITKGNLFYQIFTAGHPRATVGSSVLGYKSVITSTLFGPALLDFGALGLAIQMFILGLALKIVYNFQKLYNGAFTGFYAIILAHSLIWIETGPTDIIVWIFFVISLLTILIFWYAKLKDLKNHNYNIEGI